jgi:hypothetical protein
MLANKMPKRAKPRSASRTSCLTAEGMEWVVMGKALTETGRIVL